MLQLYSCIKDITLKMTGLLAETCGWWYYSKTTPLKLKCICFSLIRFIRVKLQVWCQLCQFAEPSFCPFFFYHGSTALVGQGILIIGDSWSHSDTPHSSGLLWTSDQPDLTTHNTHKRQTSIPMAGFEPTISESERPQTHALDCAATRTGSYIMFTSMK